MDRERVFICGGGHQGLSMAAHLALNNVDVSLWNRTRNHIQSICETGSIKCSGIINGLAEGICCSDSICEVFSHIIMVTTPSSAHKEIAGVIAPHITKDSIVILNPGRTFGAIEFAEELIRLGVKELPHIAETQTIVYTCRRIDESSVKIYALKTDVKISSIRKDDLGLILSSIPSCIRAHFTPVESVALTSFSNVGMILHCAPVLMNVGWIETEKVDFKYYYDGISKSVAGILEKMDEERLMVARAMGCKVESVVGWMKHTYKVQGNNLYECIRDNDSYREIDAPKTLECRYIFEDVPNGLVPIEYIGKQIGVSTPTISIIIDLACTVLNYNFRENGRLFGIEILQRYF